MIKHLRTNGVKQRFITEVTTENVDYCKQLGNHVQRRHLDGVKGNFGIVDGREYGAAEKVTVWVRHSMK